LNVLQLNSATTSYIRASAMLFVNGTNFPASFVAPALGNFTFNTSDRRRMEEVAPVVSAPGVGVALVECEPPGFVPACFNSSTGSCSSAPGNLISPRSIFRLNSCRAAMAWGIVFAS
jgi:hypothetical protein